MDSGGGREKSGDFYSVLGLKKACSDAELRNAYKKLAMRWHPDRCSASGNPKFVEEAKEKFQEIQEAYSVLSDSNKRFLYDVGVYDSDDDDNGMEDFLGEMAQMMSQTKPNDNGHESFEELQQLFVDMFQSDLDGGFGGLSSSHTMSDYEQFSTSSSSSSSCNGNISSHKRNNVAMDSVKTSTGGFESVSGTFCFGTNDSAPMKGSGGGSNKSERRDGRKRKVSSKHDVSSRDSKISSA